MKIKCECEGCTENNCRQVFNGETETCIQCTNVVNNDDYYKYIDGGSCQKVEPGSESLLIDSTKQIVNSCNPPYSIEMGSICYKNQPKNSVKGDDDKYKCLYNYTKDTINNLVYLNCLDLYKNCPSGYKYFTIINQRYYQCTKDSTDCNDNIYEEKIGDDTNYYCIKQCPSNKKYYYAEADNKNKCIEKCDFENHGDYFLSNKLECKKNSETSCNGHINIDKEKNIFECVEGEECLNDYPYFFEKESSGESLKYCLKSCKYTESIGFLGNIKTYIFEETDTTTNKYKCLQNTNSYSPAIYYKDELALKWVDNCKTSISGPYFNKSDLTCYNSCEKYYKDFECVVICHNDGDLDQYAYKDESTKICYTECPTNLGKGFYNDQNQCQSCNLGEGYYKINDRECYSGGDFCKINDKNYYYNYDDNYCFEKECKDYSKYKYHMSGGYKCHKSCSDLYTETEINIFEKDYTCYTVDPGTSGDFKYKYKSSSEFTKYITENQLTECLELNLKYLKNSECVKECDTSDYIVLPQQNRMGKCLSNTELTESNGCKYYNKSKICSNQCNFNKILEDGNLKVIDNENCVEKCPNDFYENAYDKTCLNTCGNELYHDEATHKCVSKCNPGFYEVEPKKKCVDKCKKIEDNLEKFAYYMDTGECKSNCPETHPYSYDTTNDHQLCLKNCTKYHKDNICMDECKYYSKGECADNCSGFAYIHPGNICSNEECPKSAPFFYSDSSSTTPTCKICNTSCPENYYKNYKSGGNSNNNNTECISSCVGAIFNDGCYDVCPKGLYNSKGNCITNCPKKFYKSENEYKCIENCNDISEYDYLTSSGECVKDCPLGENYIGSDNKCLNRCENDGYFELFKGENYNIYKCVETCDNTGNKKYVNGTKECISDCGEYYEYNNICYKNCLGIEGYSFSLKEAIEGENKYKYTCAGSCGDKYYGNNHICIDSCNELPFNKTVNYSNSCVTECDLQSDYKFLERESDDRLSCKIKCNDNKRYLTSNYKCIDDCPSLYIFVVIDGNNPAECLTKCPDTMPYATKNGEGEYVCSDIKCNKFYYSNNNTCTDNCNEGDYVLEIDGLKICTTYCDYYDSKRLYYYEKDTEKKCVFSCKGTEYEYTSIDGKCVNSCNENEYYDENDYVCKFRCPTGKKIDGKICREKCNNETLNLAKFENENGYCVDNCSESKTAYIYNKEGEFKCLNNCSDLYIENNVCKASCGSNFISGKNCVNECKIPKQFYTNEDDKKVCLNDCPEDKSFYTDEGNDKFMCTDTCDAYIQNINSNINAKKCLGDCKGDYPYYILEDEANESSRKICLNSCPSSHPYYLEDVGSDSQNIRCFKKCPENKVHLPDKYKCNDISDCGTKIIDYKKKECVERCSISDSFYVKNDIKYCVDNCTFAENYILEPPNTIDLKLTYNKECVAACPDNSTIDGKLCVCKRLFYIDKSTGDKTCLTEDLTLCETISGYPIINIDTNECTDYCDGILSLSGFECYNYDYICKENETLKTSTNGNKQCDCVDKYYYITENERKIKKCLGKNEECPSSYSMYIKDTKECVNVCPTTGIYNKQYGKTCVSSCPSSTTENNGKCECSGKWYVTDKYDVVCLEKDCPINKELLIEETKQCVSSCIGTQFEVYCNKKCIANCDGQNDREITDSAGNIYVENISKKYCRCKGPWYYDINGNEICDSGHNYCDQLEGINLKFTISPTNQCVKECPPEYKYSFGHLCFKNCEIASTSLNKELLTDDNLKTCKCIKYWKNENNEIICLDSYQGYKLINDTKECIDIEESCPKEYPLLFNNICYKNGKCPEEKNVHYDSIKEECTCVGKWYVNSGEIICLDESQNCPSSYPYLIYSTKECRENKDSSLYEFNNIFYSKCPQNTTVEGDNKLCICNPLLGYYYFNITDGIKICALDKCPGELPLYEDQKKECLTDCSVEYPYLYQGICYQECPKLTESVDNSKECQIKSLDTEITLENLEKQMSENIVELYSKSNTYNSQNVRQKIVTTNATVEFYGVNKNNKGNGNKNIQSDLSYIDISSCLDKIYKINNMKNTDDIIILKYDLNMIPEKLLINPVEYKFINSRTGQELDATVCDHNSIKISYPVHDLINKYDKMMKSLRKLEYIKIDLISNNKDSLREKLDKGKEIIQDYSETDIFNINDRIYSDICVAVEVDGKDLILEDRINYFYPQIALCENNCTYNSTDFINERIYCDCSYKIEFDFKREYSTPFELNLKEVNNNQKGNSNIAVMKCLSNLKDSKSFKNNGGFIFTLIIILVEVALLLINIFYGINSLSNKMKNKMVESEDDLDKKKITVITSPNKRAYEDVKTSQRILDNPPKKKVADFDMEFIPQEYLFLFFNKGQKNVRKKVERNNLPFKIGLNTKIILEQIKGVNYNNIKPTGPFPPGQNLIFIIDSEDENIKDYLKLDNEVQKGEQNNEYNNDKKDDDEMSEKKSEKPTIYKNKKNQLNNSDYDPSDENYSIFDIDEAEGQFHEKTFIESLKRNQRLIKKNYTIAITNKNTNFFETLLIEIIDKIYIIKILLFTKKFDILPLQLSIYLLCHTLLLVLNALFFDVKTIKKIWNEENYPGLGYYLGYGLLSCIIIWIIYKIFLCLLSNNDKTKEVLKMIHYNNKYNLGKIEAVKKKYSNLMWKIKFKISIYSIIEFLLLIFAFLYLTVLCSVYTGTKSRVFKAYGIALIEVLIIKIIYGIVLAILRYVSLSYRKKGLYDVVLFMNTYLV